MRKVLIINILSAVAFLAIACRMQAQTTTPTQDNTQWAVVNVSDAFMRAEPRYTSECVSQTRMGTLVQVLERKGYWVRIKTPEPYEGWVNELALAPTRELSPEEQKETKLYGATLAPMTRKEAEEYLKAPKLIMVGSYLHNPQHVFKDKGTSNPSKEIISTLQAGNIVLEGESKWSASKQPWTRIVLPDGRKGMMVNAFRRLDTWAEEKAQLADTLLINNIIAIAKEQLGVPYLWGGMSPGHFDCSGLTGFCYFMNGILLPRDASQQVKCGVEIPFDQMQKGDLVFFGDNSVGHVALCIGSHKIIHASQLVRINSLIPGEKDYYGRNILHIRRIIGHLKDGETPAIPIKDSPSYFVQ